MNRSRFLAFPLLVLAGMLVAVPAFAGKKPAGPKITNITPTTGPVLGGTTVAVNGSGFLDGATVTFGGTAAASVVFVSASELSAVTPPMPAGAVDVRVTNPGGENVTLAGGFTYFAPESNVRCTWADPADSAHPAISGEETSLRAIVLSSSPNLTYAWDFGDGTAVENGVVDDPYAIEATHTYTGSLGTIYTATLTVNDGATTVGTDTYTIVIADDTLDTRKKIAIERGLWYSHKNTTRDNAPAEHGGMPRGYINNTGGGYSGWDVPLNTMVSGTGFAESGFKANGDRDNPYTEDMRRYVNYVTERLAILPIGIKGDGSPQFPYLDPEDRTGSMIDGYGVYFDPESETEYEYGIALRFLANCGYTSELAVTYNDALNYTGDPSVSLKNWTILEIVQQMIDFFAWAQVYDVGNDYGRWTCQYDDVLGYWTCNQSPPSKSTLAVADDRRGSWPYWSEGVRRLWDPVAEQWIDVSGSYGDTSLAYWVVSGLKFAQKQGCVWPDFVRTELDRYLDRNQDLDQGSPYRGEFHFGEGYGHHLVERAGHGLVLLKWVGRKSNNSAVSAAKGYIDQFWTRHNYEHEQDWSESLRGENQCTSEITGQPDDCFSHWSTTQQTEFGHWSPVWSCQYECLSQQCQGGDVCTWIYRDEPVGSGVNWGWYYDCTWDPCATTVCLEQGPSCIEGTRYISDYVYVLDAVIDQMNLFAMMTVTEGLTAVNINGGFPTTDTMNWKERYLRLLVDNQLPDGMWNDRGWVWDSGFGTGWALMILANL